MTAPTEAEIREAARAAVPDSSDEIGSIVYSLLGPIRYIPPDEDLSGLVNVECLWDDLRPSQAARLAELLDDIYEKVDAHFHQQVIPIIRELVVEAALTFTAEHPDAPPRSKPQLVPA